MLTSTLIVRIISKAVYYLINGKIVFIIKEELMNLSQNSLLYLNCHSNISLI